jgi:hypothetical protein
LFNGKSQAARRNEAARRVRVRAHPSSRSWRGSGAGAEPAGLPTTRPRGRKRTDPKRARVRTGRESGMLTGVRASTRSPARAGLSSRRGAPAAAATRVPGGGVGTHDVDRRRRRRRSPRARARPRRERKAAARRGSPRPALTCPFRCARELRHAPPAS